MPLCLFSQGYTTPSKMEVQGVVINLADQTVKTQMLNNAGKYTASNDKTYLWYGSQTLMETHGGFDGRLIHGTYTAFYLNNQLKEKGRVKYGLRNREWKYWYPDGRLREVITWKMGVKNGPYALYNDFGQPMAKGRFKNDKLHGKFYTYGNGGSILEKKRYRNGEEIIKKPRTKTKAPKPAKTESPAREPDKPSFFKRLFKKKDKPAKEQKPKAEKNKPVNS